MRGSLGSHPRSADALHARRPDRRRAVASRRCPASASRSRQDHRRKRSRGRSRPAPGARSGRRGYRWRELSPLLDMPSLVHLSLDHSLLRIAPPQIIKDEYVQEMGGEDDPPDQCHPLHPELLWSGHDIDHQQPQNHRYECGEMALERHLAAHPPPGRSVRLVALVATSSSSPAGPEGADRSVELDALEAFVVSEGHDATPARAAIFRKLLYIRRPISPLFSGWNCVATTLSRAITDGNVTPYSVSPITTSGSSG